MSDKRLVQPTVTGPSRTRRFTITAFTQKGEIGDGGLAFRVGTTYGSEEAAIARTRRYIAEGWDPVERFLIKKGAGEVCWLTTDGEVVRRDLDALPFGAAIWGYAS